MQDVLILFCHHLLPFSAYWQRIIKLKQKIEEKICLFYTMTKSFFGYHNLSTICGIKIENLVLRKTTFYSKFKIIAQIVKKPLDFKSLHLIWVEHNNLETF